MLIFYTGCGQWQISQRKPLQLEQGRNSLSFYQGRYYVGYAALTSMVYQRIRHIHKKHCFVIFGVSIETFYLALVLTFLCGHNNFFHVSC